MAIRTVSNTGGNYNAVGTWVEGIVPTSADDIVFTATSGNLTVNVTSDAKSINFTNYVGTLTISASFRVFGNINLGTGGYTVTGVNSLNVFDTSTITSNGVSFQGNFAFSGSNKTYTLADDLTILGVLSLNGTGTYTCNGFNIYCSSSLQVLTTGTFTGTSNIIFNGTGSWSHILAGIITNNITINTSGTLTINTARYSVGTLTYTSGTVVNIGGNLVLYASCTLNTIGIGWNNVLIVSAGTITNNSTLTINGTFTIGSGTISTTINGSDIIINGNLSYTSISDSGAGTALFKFAGTGTWTSVGFLRNNVSINTAGTLTLSGNIYYYGGTITYVAGTIVNTGSTLNVGVTTTLNTSGMTWNNVQPAGNTTLTLSSDLNVGGNLSLPTQVTFTINGFNVNLKGNLNLSNGSGTAGLLTGTTVIKFNGTSPQTWSSPSVTNTVTNNLIFLNDVTISGQVYFRSGTITYTSGTITTTGSTLQLLAGALTLNTVGMVWNNVVCNGTTTRTLSSTLTCNSLSIINGNNTFAGSGGFICGTLTMSTFTLTLPPSVVNTITISMVSLTATLASKALINCSTIGGAKAILNLAPGATQDNGYVSATDIDSSGGRSIWTYKGVLTRTINWNVMSTNPKKHLLKYKTKILQ